MKLTTMTTATILTIATATSAMAGGGHTHQTTAPQGHGSARDISVGPNDFHHHHADGSRHFLVCAEAVPYKGYGTVGPIYIKDDGTFYQVTRVEGGLVHTRMDKDCEVTSRVFLPTDNDDRPKPTTGDSDDEEDTNGGTGDSDGGNTGGDDEGDTGGGDTGGDDDTDTNTGGGDDTEVTDKKDKKVKDDKKVKKVKDDKKVKKVKDDKSNASENNDKGGNTGNGGKDRDGSKNPRTR